MSDIRDAQKELVNRILAGEGKASSSLRRAAFDNSDIAEPLHLLIDKVAMHADTVIDEDISAAKAAGLSEDQIFEVLVCAAIGQAVRQYDAAMATVGAAIRGD